MVVVSFTYEFVLHPFMQRCDEKNEVKHSDMVFILRHAYVTKVGVIVNEEDKQHGEVNIDHFHYILNWGDHCHSEVVLLKVCIRLFGRYCLKQTLGWMVGHNINLKIYWDVGL